MPAYTHAGASRCTTLSILEVQSLCDLLTLPPNLSPSSSFFHTSQYSKLTSTTQPLPPAILQPAGVFADIKKSLHLSLPIPTHLCLTHAGLNQEVIYSIYKTFEAEVVQHTKSLSRYADKHYDIPTSIKAWLNRMNAMTSLWYTPNEVYRYFPSTKNLLLLPYVESECEACTLSIVGGRPDVLFDLRASLVSRTSTKDKKVPRLLRFVEAWVEGGEHVSVMKDTSSALGAEIKVVRREQKRAHRERKMRENKEVEKKNYGARDRGSGSRSDKMRNSMESPSSISALYAAETESHTTSTTSRREREDFLRSKDSRNPSQHRSKFFLGEILRPRGSS